MQEVDLKILKLGHSAAGATLWLVLGQYTVFFQSDAGATICLLFIIVWVLFKGGYYSKAAFFLWKTCRRSWIRYIQVIQ